MADNDPKVTNISPQTDKALNIKDPSTIDDTVVYHYDSSSAKFALTSYTTFVQDTKTPNNPARFPSSENFAPSTSSFILEVTGTGFDNANKSIEPLKMFMVLDGYIAIIPALPSSTDFSVGNAFGYVIKSATKIWIYFSRTVFNKIWVPYDQLTFDGTITVNQRQLESGSDTYPLLGKDLPLNIWVTPNNRAIFNKTNYFYINNFPEPLIVNLTQSPFIITINGNKLNTSTIYPHAEKNGSKVYEIIYLYGHNLNSQHVMMVKTSSTLLKTNPSAIPQDVLSKTQDEAAIKKMSAQELSTLEYFKEGFFLNPIKSFTPKSSLKSYSYLAPDGTITNIGKTGKLPADKLSIVQFSINTLPAGTYRVVVYNSITGDYDTAPLFVTIDLHSGKIQIHDVSPETVVLQSPSFTVNGFNFPTTNDINNGAVFTISLVGSSKTNAVAGQKVSSLFGAAAFLQIDKTSPVNSKNGNGTITLTSDSQFTAKFTNLHVTDLTKITDNTFKMYIEVAYKTQNIAKGKINEAALSDILQVEKQPVINFLTNSTTALPDDINGAYKKSLVRVDQSTGKVIAFGQPEDFLYIVGKNFNTGKTISVSIKGIKQEAQSTNWPLDSTLNAIRVKVDPSNIKGDATVEVKVGSASSEAFQFSTLLKSKNSVQDAKGKHTKEKQTLEGNDTKFFSEILPYNQLDQHTLLNSSNTKVSSSIALTLSNQQTKQSIDLKADLNTSVALPFLPDQITIPAKTKLTSNGNIDVTFYFYNLYNINISTPKIFRLQHSDPAGTFGGVFQPKENMLVVGSGFVNGMRYNINNTGWTVVPNHGKLLVDKTVFQTFNIIVPDSKTTDATLKISNDQAQQVQSASTAGKQNGSYKVGTINVNDKYSPLLKINQRLPAGIKMYAKGTHNTMTDRIDASMSIFGQITPFLGSFKTLLIVIRVIVCVIDVICALINPFQLIVAIIALMDCIIDLLSLFPQLAVPIMILSFLQNFVGFLETFIQQITAYVFSIVNSQLALLNSRISQDLAQLAAAEQQAFGATKQIRDVIALLEPALQIIQIFKDLLNFAMHFPCASNQGSSQNDGTCPPGNMQKLMQEIVQDKTVAPNTYGISVGDLVRVNGVVTGITTIPNKLTTGTQFIIAPGEQLFPTGTKTVESIIDSRTFTYNDAGIDGASTRAATVDTVVTTDQQSTLATMFCQAVAMQTATLQTMPGFNGLDSFGNPLPGGPLSPGSTSVVPTLTPVLPNIAAAIECMNNYTDQIDAALNAGQVFITTEAQGQQLVAAYTQCVQNLIDQTNQGLGDICVLAVSALNSELKVSPKGRIGPDMNDDFIKTKLALPSTNPNSLQDSGLTLDLAQLAGPNSIPTSITTDPLSGATTSTQNFGTKQDIYTPIIFTSTNKSGVRQSPNTIYFNADNQDVGGLISIGDIIEIVGGTFNGLQFPILAVQPLFTAVRLTCKLDLTFEQKLLVGEQPLPGNLSGFDVKIIAHLAGNDAVAVVPADDISVATIQIFARDHHGHEIGAGLANKVAIKIESGTAEYVPIIPSSTTDITGVIQEQGTHYIANLKANCSGTVIVSSSVCGVEFVDIGYHANDINHAITTRKKTVKIIFTPPIPKPLPGAFEVVDKVQVPGTDFVN